MKPLDLIHTPLKSQDGSVLIQLIIASALIAIVGLTGAHLSASTKQFEVRGDISNTVHQTHLIALQRSRNLTALLTVLTDPVVGLDLSPNSNVSKCLRGTPAAGFDCHTLDQAGFTTIPQWTQSFSLGSTRQVDTSSSFKLICPTASGCTEIRLRVESQHAGEYHKSSDLHVTGDFITNPTEISFTCSSAPSDQVVTGINFQTREAICGGTPLTTYNCGGNEPITDISASGTSPTCATLTAQTCVNGMQKIGLMASQNSPGDCL